MYDLIIIGMGPGGFEATLLSLRKKLNIAIVEQSKIGGNCLNRACIPTKYFWTGAHQISKMSILKEYGILADKFEIDFSKGFEGKEKAITFLRKSLSMLLKSKKVPVYKGYGRIIDKNKVEVKKNDGTVEIIEGKNILISTGSIPISVGGLTPDGENILTTEDILENMNTLPEEIAVIGGGVAGCELGYVLSKYGVKVHIIELMDRLLPSKEISSEISKYLLRKFKQNKINVYLNTTVKQHFINDEKIKVELSDGNILNVDKILLTVGRKPNSDIDEIGIEKDDKGFIKVNKKMQTNFENIYACGDVVNSPMLAYVASYEAKIAVKNILGKEEEVNYDLIPYVIFFANEIATVGISEDEAKKSGLDIVTGYYPFTYNEKAVDEHENDGFVKLIFDKETKKILGGSIVGTGASEMIHLIQLFIKEKYTAEKIHDFIYFHPSLSEIFIYATYDVVEGKLF
ncbi:dihydrolipoyl dehydrogenase [Persephonella sp.]